jgi:hypothetical protein
MSGTPVENRMSEYWSIMDFTNKGYLGSQKFFQRTYAYPDRSGRRPAYIEAFPQSLCPFYYAAAQI